MLALCLTGLTVWRYLWRFSPRCSWADQLASLFLIHTHQLGLFLFPSVTISYFSSLTSRGSMLFLFLLEEKSHVFKI